MIGKNEQPEVDNTNGARVNLMSEKRKSLRDTSAKVKEEVRLCFEQLANVLRTREKQLLRQIEAVHNQQLTIVQSNLEIPYSLPSIRINLSDKRDLEGFILKFGELSSSERNGIDVRDAEPYKIEDYEEADKDHVTLDKSIKSEPDNDRIANDAAEKFNDSSDSPCDLSFDTSSEDDANSENEITVLMANNYSPSSDGLRENRVSPKLSVAETNRACSNNCIVDEDELLNNSPKWELKVTAQPIRRSGDYIVPETDDNSTVENCDLSVKENFENSSMKPDKKICSSTDSRIQLENLEENSDVTMRKQKKQDGEKHPKQIQQWLEQILVETETEPTIHEIEQFAEISKSRFKEFQFPLET